MARIGRGAIGSGLTSFVDSFNKMFFPLMARKDERKKLADENARQEALDIESKRRYDEQLGMQKAEVSRSISRQGQEDALRAEEISRSISRQRQEDTRADATITREEKARAAGFAQQNKIAQIGVGPEYARIKLQRELADEKMHPLKNEKRSEYVKRMIQFLINRPNQYAPLQERSADAMSVAVQLADQFEMPDDLADQTPTPNPRYNFLPGVLRRSGLTR